MTDIGVTKDIGDNFRHALRRMAASVSIVTTARGEERAGATVSSVVSVSFEPLSLLCCLHTSSRLYDMIREQDAFCVNLLDRTQSHLSDKFSRPASEKDLFGSDEWGWHLALPYLDGAQANFFLDIKKIVPFGTHEIIVGEVRDIFYAEDIAPLIYLNGSYS